MPCLVFIQIGDNYEDDGCLTMTIDNDIFYMACLVFIQMGDNDNDNGQLTITIDDIFLRTEHRTHKCRWRWDELTSSKMTIDNDDGHVRY